MRSRAFVGRKKRCTTEATEFTEKDTYALSVNSVASVVNSLFATFLARDVG
jgi:hypothetical protein